MWSIFKRIKPGLNFRVFLGRNRFVPFPKASARSETQTESSRVWNRVADFISCTPKIKNYLCIYLTLPRWVDDKRYVTVWSGVITLNRTLWSIPPRPWGGKYIPSKIGRKNYWIVIISHFRKSHRNSLLSACKIHPLHLCWGVRPPQRVHLRTGSWWLCSPWPSNRSGHVSCSTPLWPLLKKRSRSPDPLNRLIMPSPCTHIISGLYSLSRSDSKQIPNSILS